MTFWVVLIRAADLSHGISLGAMVVCLKIMMMAMSVNGAVAGAVAGNDGRWCGSASCSCVVILHSMRLMMEFVHGGALCVVLSWMDHDGHDRGGVSLCGSFCGS